MGFGQVRVSDTTRDDSKRLNGLLATSKVEFTFMPVSLKPRKSMVPRARYLYRLYYTLPY